MRTFVKSEDAYRVADCDFANPAHVVEIQNWRGLPGLLQEPDVRDAIEFSMLAGKRWHSYQDLGSTIDSLEALQERIAEDPRAECVMLASLTSREGEGILGFALFRRTWCNHLALDFLASHPKSLGTVKGVGIALTSFLCQIAQVIDAHILWLETTPSSARKYARWFEVEGVKDLLIVERSQMDEFLADHLHSLQTAGLPE